MVRLFDEIPRLEGKSIVLDKVMQSDAPGLQELVDSKTVYRYLPTFLFEKQHDDVRETIDLLYRDLFTNKESLILCVRSKHDGAFCGFAECYGLREELNKISIGYRLLERCWGHGIASQAVSLMVNYLYDQTNIELITASTMVENIASAQVLRKNGFICTTHAVEEDWGYDTPTIADKWFC